MSKQVQQQVIDSHKQTQDKMVRTVDGFANFASRVGTSPNMDNQLSQSFYEYNLLTRNRVQLGAAYRGSWVVGVMVDAVAEDMTRAGIDITSNEAAKDVQDFQACLQRLQVWNSLCDIIKWARLYGGAIGVMMIEGQDLSTPLKIETIDKGQFTGIDVYDRWQLQPNMTKVIKSGPNIGLPAFYNIITAADLLGNEIKENMGAAVDENTGSIRVHHSRIIRQIGVKLPFWEAITEQMWGMSEIERIHDRLVSFDNTTLSSANLINHAHLRTVRIDSLREILAQGGKAEEGLVKMFDYMRLLQNNEGLTLLDKNDEFSANAYSFSGLSDMMLQFGQQLSGASGIPLVRMFGQSPAGLNSTGESDLRMYYDNINAQQNANLRPGMDVLLRVAWQSFFGRPAPKDLQYTFAPLWQMTPEQKSNIAKTDTETVNSAYESGLVKRSTAVKELRQSSHKTGLFSNITDEEILESEKEDEVPMPDELSLLGEPSQEDEVDSEDIDEEGDIDPTASLNGAQVTSMLTVINQVSSGQLPRETAVKMMAAAFPISEQEASNILGKVGKGFKPSGATDSFTEAKHKRNSNGQFGETVSKLDKARSSLGETQEREEAAAKKVQELQVNGKEWWNSPEYKAAATEYKSAVRARQRAIREGKKLIAKLKSGAETNDAKSSLSQIYDSILAFVAKK